MSYFEGDLNGEIEANPWKISDVKEAIVPETFPAEVVQVTTELPSRNGSPLNNAEESGEEGLEVEEVDIEKIYSLDTTANEQELREKCLLLKQKLKSKYTSDVGEIKKLTKAQAEHQRQASENKILREYVANLLQTTSSSGFNKYGVSFASYQRRRDNK